MAHALTHMMYVLLMTTKPGTPITGHSSHHMVLGTGGTAMSQLVEA
jgi:hypothetical protein